MPGALPLWKAAALTMLSASDADSEKSTAEPVATASEAGHEGTTSAATPPPPQGASGVALLRGLGVPAMKSAPLLFVSVQPLAARSAAVVFDRPGAAAAPSKPVAA